MSSDNRTKWQKSNKQKALQIRRLVFLGGKKKVVGLKYPIALDSSLEHTLEKSEMENRNMQTCQVINTKIKPMKKPTFKDLFVPPLKKSRSVSDPVSTSPFPLLSCKWSFICIYIYQCVADTKWADLISLNNSVICSPKKNDTSLFKRKTVIKLTSKYDSNSRASFFADSFIPNYI